MKILQIIFLCMFFLSIGQNGFAQDVDVDEIVSKANLAAFYQGNTGKATVNMTITDSQGRTRNREFVILRMNVKEGAEQKFYVFFNKPEDVKGMVYMVWKNIEKDDDRWLYLPALDLVRRVAASDERSSFVGSNFLYEDVSGRGITEDIHELKSENEKFYQLRNTPKDPDSVEFKYYDLVIDKANFLPKIAEYYNDKGELYRVVEALEVGDINGIPTVIKSKASNLENSSFTITEFTDVVYNISITDDIFTERYLRRPPNKWIR